LSPLIWSLSRPYVDRVARALIESVENPALSQKKSLHGSCFDF
ncbi:MAG: SRPBCC family protein, partial [Dolichospermum sp.]|nr:SRPBCC family protein [Dolichospermum sp.]